MIKTKTLILLVKKQISLGMANNEIVSMFADKHGLDRVQRCLTYLRKKSPKVYTYHHRTPEQFSHGIDLPEKKCVSITLPLDVYRKIQAVSSNAAGFCREMVIKNYEQELKDLQENKK